MRRAVLPLFGIVLSTLCFLPIVRASDAIKVDRTMDFFVVINVPTLFIAETDLCEDTEAYWCNRPPFQDSVLWIYDDAGNLLAVNDDDARKAGQSWNSYLELQLDPGVYRLRAGKFGPCDETGCLHPEAPFDENCYYNLSSNVALLLDPNAPSASIEPIPSILPEPSPSIDESFDPTFTLEPTPTATLEPSFEASASPIESLLPSEVPTQSFTIEPSAAASYQASETPAVIYPSPSVSVAPTELPSIAVSPTPEASAEIIATTNPVEAVAQAVDAAINKITHLGQDLTPEQKTKARPVAIAIVVSQIASAAAAAAANIRKGK